MAQWKVGMKSGGKPVVWTRGPFEIRRVAGSMTQGFRQFRLYRLGRTVGIYDDLSQAKRAAPVLPKRKRNPGAGNLLTAAILGAGAFLAWRVFKRKRTLGPVEPPRPGPVIPPPAPQPGAQHPNIPYQAGGETVMKLHAGDEFVVTWDESSPWRYVAQDTDTVQAIDSDEGSVRFHVAAQLPAGGVSQVYVQAVDENDDVLGEHKFSVLGP